MGSFVKSVTTGSLGLGNPIFKKISSKSGLGTGDIQGTLGLTGFDTKGRKISGAGFQVKDLEKKKEKLAGVEKEAQDRESTSLQQRQDLIKRLEAQSKGEGPSLAKAQLKAATDRNLAQQLGAAGAQRGGSASSRQRQLARAQAAGGRDVAQQAAVARMAEQQNAQQLLASEVGDELALASQLRGKYLQLGFNIDEADQAARRELESLAAGHAIQSSRLGLQAFEGESQRRQAFNKDLVSGIGTAVMSDERQKKKITRVKNKDLVKKLRTMSSEDEKKNISKLDSFADYNSSDESKSLDTFSKIVSQDVSIPKPIRERKDSNNGESSKPSPEMIAALTKASDEKVKKNKKDFNPKGFLDKLKAYSYEYKNPELKGAGEGTHVSVMAQDLEKAGPVGKSMVVQNEQGIKMVDYGKGFGAILAAQTHLNERLNALETKKSKKRKG